MNADILKQVAMPVSDYYASFPAATSKLLEGSWRTKNAFLTRVFTICSSSLTSSPP